MVREMNNSAKENVESEKSRQIQKTLCTVKYQICE